LGFVKRNKKVIMMEKTLILKHISGMLCLLISYSKFTRTGSRVYLKCRKAYAIIPVGENDRSAHVAQQKAPEVATPGLFYSVLGGWLNPKAGYQLFFSVQPFADVVGNYTCQNREKK
jgi:hypothetical protein